MGMKILGSGSSHPKKIVTNNDFVQIETSDEWIYSRTGIKSRYIAVEETTSSLAFEAAKKAILQANIDPNQIHLVLCATMTPDSFTPTVASKILHDLGIERAMAFDINVACSGFVYALKIAHSLLRKGEYALVIGAECVSKLLDFKDRNTCVLFGDGSGALLFEKNDDEAIFYANSKTDCDKILEAHGLSMLQDENILSGFKLQMNGKEVFKFALECFNDCIHDLACHGISIDDVDLIIPHQANKRIILSVCKRYNIEEEKFYLNLEKYGNTSAASIAIAVDEALMEGRLKPGMRVLMIGFGSGLSWGYSFFKL